MLNWNWIRSCLSFCLLSPQPNQDILQVSSTDFGLSGTGTDPASVNSGTGDNCKSLDHVIIPQVKLFHCHCYSPPFSSPVCHNFSLPHNSTSSTQWNHPLSGIINCKVGHSPTLIIHTNALIVTFICKLLKSIPIQLFYRQLRQWPLLLVLALLTSQCSNL